MLIGIIRFIFILSGIIGGFQIGQLIDSTYKSQNELFTILAHVLTIFILGGLGYVFGGVFGRYADRLIDKVMGSLSRYSASALMTGSLGLIVGLVVAALVSLPLSQIDYVGNYLSILTFVILGYLGMMVAGKKSSEIPAGAIKFFEQNPPKTFLPKLVDTSVIIDGRILDIARTGFLEGKILIPRYVLNELHFLADSDDDLKRMRARRGLDVMQELKKVTNVDVEIYDFDYPNLSNVDEKLIKSAREINAALLTNDFNLNKIASLEGVTVLNINELANAVKSILVPGERLEARIIKEGKERNQGIAYLDDGTMLVVEDTKDKIGETVKAVVTSILQTPAGRMIFANLEE